MNPTNTSIIIASKHCEPDEGRYKKLAPMGYGYVIIPTKEIISAYGCGLEKSTEAVLAHGLLRAAHVAFLENHDATITAVVRNAGTARYFKEFIPKWVRKASTAGKGLKKDNLPTWLELNMLGRLSSMDIRSVETAIEAEYLVKTEALAKAATDLADRKRKELLADEYKAGILLTDESEDMPSPDMLVARYASQH